VNRPEGAWTERRGIDRLGRNPGGPDEHARRGPAITPELPAALSVAAHDVGEALRVVSGYVELLDGDATAGLGESAQRYLAGVRDGVTHLDSVLTGLLAYVRVNVDTLELEDVDLRESLDEALRPLRRELERRDGRIEAGDLPTVSADASRTRELLRALLQNALAFAGDEPPVVAVSAERDRDGWRVSVRDAGIGVPDDARERVLEPFERAHSRSVSRGAGLGLAIARRIAERRGGRLWLEAAPERGTVVHFTVPDRVPST